jgi:UDP-GlcNAc:undecaprenyl-phosphate GlcNAc-1-phosphate transferase
MTTILFTFLIALIASLGLTPLVRRLARAAGLVDSPTERKIHLEAVPRIGGVALFAAFFSPFVLFAFFRPSSLAVDQIFAFPNAPGFLVGAVIIFLLGIIDDLRSLPAAVKLSGQVVVALLAYSFGFQINALSVPFLGGVTLGILSLPITVFWFVLVMNAINLADGLDGLAAGICLFVSLAMLFVCSSTDRIVEALAFASLAGTLLGFLRYNFYPASIFMGDSGSYFLGYTLAALSVAGSIKGQVATAMLIPVIALGVPLIDTLWAPFRRFVFGQKIFQPDRDHFHHKLVKLGYTQRRAVLLIYFLTIILGVGAIILVHTQNDTAGLILFVLGVGVILVTRYLGIDKFFTLRRMLSWAQDLSDEVGISHNRRSFLHHQVKITRAADLDNLWKVVCLSLEELEFESAEFKFIAQKQACEKGHSDRLFRWQRKKEISGNKDQHNAPCLLKIELPLHDNTEGHFCNFGILLLEKDMRHEIGEQYTLKRVEHLRRTMIATLLKIAPH